VDKTNEKKANQLGMPLGTATHRLRKMIMLKLLRDSGQDVCFRCGKKIESESDLSIEHKVAWMDVDVNLFWDLDNIAFSHLSCNIAVASRKKKILSPDGMQWCIGCQENKPIDEFSIGQRENSRGKRNVYCRKCNTEKKRKFRKNRLAKLMPE
jgi:hypothetical protein